MESSRGCFEAQVGRTAGPEVTNPGGRFLSGTSFRVARGTPGAGPAPFSAQPS